jgi:hypothetical protein
MAESPRLDRLARELFLLAFPHVAADAWPIEQLTNMLGGERLLQPGDVLFREGASADELFFMVRGGVTLRAAGRPDWPFAGRWVLGTFEALLGGPHRRTALVDVETLVLPVRTEEWLELAEENFELAQGTLFNMARSVAKLWSHVAPGTAIPPQGVGRAPLLPRHHTLVDRTLALRNVGAFAGAGVQALANLAAVSDEQSYQSGELVIASGLPREVLAVVIEGEVEAALPALGLSARFGPGTIVGGTSTLAWTAPETEARALTPTRILGVPFEDWLDEMEEQFELFRSYVGMVADEREWLLDQLSLQSAAAGLAR